jgi:hypothetical protein
MKMISRFSRVDIDPPIEIHLLDRLVENKAEDF